MGNNKVIGSNGQELRTDILLHPGEVACGCIGVYRKERLDESFRVILRRYQKYVIEDTTWFSI